jgi:hypothetical protein
MKPLSENLLVLIATAEDMMRRPAHQIPTQLPADFGNLADAIRLADAQPCDGINRATRAGVVMVTAIEGFFYEQSGDHHWQMLIGATLPLLRRAAWQALKNEKSVAEESRR